MAALQCSFDALPPSPTDRRRRWRTRLAVTLGALSLVACGGGGGQAGGGTPPVPPTAPAPTFTAAQMLPLAAGHRWVYALRDDQNNNVDTLVVQVQGQETLPGGAAWRLSTRSQTDPAQDADEYYRVEAEGLRSVPGPLSDPFTTQLGPALVLRAGFSPGDTWTALERDLGQTLDVDGDGRLDRVRARAVVTVLPVTTHQAGSTTLTGVAQLRTVTTLTVGPGAGGPDMVVTIQSDDWYAPGIGPVRNLLTFNDPDFGTSAGASILAWSVATRRSDTQAPTLTAAVPAPGASTRFAELRYSFSEAMDRRSMAEDGFVLRDAQGQALAGNVVWNAAGTDFEFVPVFALGEGAYSASFGAGATDLSGNEMAPVALAFNIDRTGPVLVRSLPLPDATGFAIDGVIELEFNEPLGNQNPLFRLTRLDTGAELGLTVQVQGSLLRLQPETSLVPGAPYRLTSIVELVDVVGTPGNTVLLEFQAQAQGYGLAQPLAGLLGGQQTNLAADLDGDGRTDLLVIAARTGGDAASPSLLWLRQQPTGGPGLPLSLPLPAHCVALDVDSGDVDADGLSDVLVTAFSTTAQPCGVAWLRQATAGAFEFGGWVWQDNVPALARLMPVQGASRPGVVLAGGIDLWLLRPEGAAGYGVAQALPRPVSGITDLAVGDLDGDGRADLVLLGGTPSATRAWATLRQEPDGSFAVLGEPRDIGLACCTAGVALGAADTQGRREVFVIDGQNEAPAVQQWLPAGAGVWTLATPLPTAPLPHAVVLADVNGDGRLDVVTGHADQGLVGVTLRRADGLWEAQALSAVPVGGRSPRGLAVADFNGDGRPDIVLEGSLLLAAAELAAGPMGPAAAGARATRVPGLVRPIAEALRAFELRAPALR